METEDASETSVTINRHIWLHNAEVSTYTVHLFTADYYWQGVTGLWEILSSGCPHAASHCHSYGCKRQVPVIAENDMRIRNGHSQVSMKPLKKSGAAKRHWLIHVSVADNARSQRNRNLAKNSASMNGQAVENRRHCEMFISETRCTAGECTERGEKLHCMLPPILCIC